MRRITPLALVLPALAAACARDAQPPRTPRANLRALGVGGPVDPTVVGARITPEVVDDDRTYGVEPGGGVRSIASGIRVVSMPDGAVMAADERLPQAPSQTLALPDRLGGGFLFVLGSTLWRADRWLSDARPIYTHASTIATVVTGLDRAYVRSSLGGYQAIDARTGQRLDLGPWPAGPTVVGYTAIDGWRAGAIVDLRGAVVTSDAGASWKTVPLPIQPQTVLAMGDSLVVGGRETSGTLAWFEVRADGQAGRMAGAPRASDPPPPIVSTMSPDARPFGKRPLTAAIEDGWPLTDGTAVVARDGAIARVRLSDGALLEVAGDAFPMKPARCHGVSLNRPTAVGAFGFVCGEPRGATVLYAYDPGRGLLQELKRFDRPRLVLTSGNGALAIRGGCAETAASDDGDGQHTYCLLPLDSRWREVHVRGEIGDERVVVLSDGRVAIVSPPRGDVSTARLTILDKGRATTVPIAFASPPADVARALRLGVWMEGFEERRAGVLGGWIEAGGAVLGIEIALDGAGKLGQLIRDVGAPIVSGRYGLGWSGARRAYESVDGGMTWSSLEVPEPAAGARTTGRACGPIGCTSGGWLRVGWGPSKKTAPKDAPPVASGSYTRTPALELVCEPTAPPPPVTPTPRPRAATEVTPRPSPHLRVAPPALGGVVGSAAPEMQPFYAMAAPALRPDERGLSAESNDPGVRGALARYYAWGPKTGEWDRTARWMVRWTSPFVGSQEIASSLAGPPPQVVLDLSRTPSGYSYPYGGMYGSTWQLTIGDDAKHALLVAKRPSVRELAVFALEADRAPVELRRADGEPFTAIDAAVRAGDHWFLASAPEGDLPSTVIWQVDGGQARELLRVPRVGIDARSLAASHSYPSPYAHAALQIQTTGARVARRSDGRAVGFVVDGQASADRSVPTRWVLPIDVESSSALEPESLGAKDLGDRTIGPCAGDETGWVLDAPLDSVSVKVTVGARTVPLTSPFARLRLWRQGACAERLAGETTSFAGEVALLSRAARAGIAPRADGPAIAVATTVARTRYPLRCVRRPSPR